ncbi:hypothetical protein CBOM_07494 [Ceraceosorus bombacis]|uniref:Uncharacterized protein n=1 Tax=Ceraceosorus bombacis TaxID=401625 RepID=A0A0P1B9G6_9BASI|nr:hypothetical protein CBOM_07494 [Ceraceosorus bombacis]
MEHQISRTWRSLERLMHLASSATGLLDRCTSCAATRRGACNHGFVTASVRRGITATQDSTKAKAPDVTQDCMAPKSLQAFVSLPRKLTITMALTGNDSREYTHFASLPHCQGWCNRIFTFLTRSC